MCMRATSYNSLPAGQVAKVLTVDEIQSDKLFKTTVDVGGGEVRQVTKRSFLTQR